MVSKDIKSFLKPLGQPLKIDQDVLYMDGANEIGPGYCLGMDTVSTMLFWRCAVNRYADGVLKTAAVKNMKETVLTFRGSGDDIYRLTGLTQCMDLNRMAIYLGVGEVGFLEDKSVDGIILDFSKSETPECARCWERRLYSWPRKPEVGSVEGSPDLCRRCSLVLKGKDVGEYKE